MSASRRAASVLVPEHRSSCVTVSSYTAALRSGFILPGLLVHFTLASGHASAANLTGATGNRSLTNPITIPQANDEIIYDKTKPFCITFAPGTNTGNFRVVGDHPDALITTKQGGCSLGGNTGFIVEVKARKDYRCDPTADIVVDNGANIEMARKRLKILRPIKTRASPRSNGIYRCGAFPQPFVTPATNLKFERPGAGVMWDVVIVGELDANGNEPVYDGSVVDEMVVPRADGCSGGRTTQGSGIINRNGTPADKNVWEDLLGLCKAKTDPFRYDWLVGCETQSRQELRIGKCDFPGASINSVQSPITHAHKFQVGFFYHNERNDPPSSSTTIPIWNQ